MEISQEILWNSEVSNFSLPYVFSINKISVQSICSFCFSELIRIS